MSIKKKGKAYLPPKLPTGEKYAEVEKAKQQIETIKRSRRDVQYVKRGILLKDAVKNNDPEPDPNAYGLNELKQKELIELRRQNVNEIVLNSR